MKFQKEVGLTGSICRSELYYRKESTDVDRAHELKIIRWALIFEKQDKEMLVAERGIESLQIDKILGNAHSLRIQATNQSE